MMEIFPDYSRDLFNTILEEEKLKFDRNGRRRTAYSLRHTYISMRSKAAWKAARRGAPKDQSAPQAHR